MVFGGLNINYATLCAIEIMLIVFFNCPLTAFWDITGELEVQPVFIGSNQRAL